MRRDTAEPPGVGRSDPPRGTRTAVRPGERPGERSGGRPGGRPATGPGRRPAPGGAPPPLRLTRRGLVVLGVAALLVVGLPVLLVARLLGGGAEPAHAPAADVIVVPDPACEPTADQSQNCWPIFTDGADDLLERSPWVTGRLLAGDVRTVLDHVAARFDAEVERVDPATSWGWANRAVRGEGADVVSNHASGTAIDLNATEHPIGARDTFSDAQVETIRAIVAEVAPVVAWGGDYGGRSDEMHFEIVGTPEQVAEVAARLVTPAP